jgi:hypothetical protein
VTDLLVHPSAEAERHGWSEAFGSEPLVSTISRYGRGERARADTPSPILLIPVTNVPSYVHRSSEIA